MPGDAELGARFEEADGGEFESARRPLPLDPLTLVNVITPPAGVAPPYSYASSVSSRLRDSSSSYGLGLYGVDEEEATISFSGENNRIVGAGWPISRSFLSLSGSSDGALASAYSIKLDMALRL